MKEKFARKNFDENGPWPPPWMMIMPQPIKDPSMFPALGGESPEGNFKDADADGDGSVGENEYMMWTFDYIDMDLNMMISLDEWEMYAMKMPKAFMMLNVDSSPDGLDWNEYKKGFDIRLNEENGYGTKKGTSFSVYEPTEMYIVKKMLKMAKLKEGETVFDIGSGDGRSIVMAAKEFKARAIGIELHEGRAKFAKEVIKKENLKDLAKVRNVDGRTVKDYRKANVVFLYLTDHAINILKPIFEKQLKKGTRIVSHGFPIPGWKTVKSQVVGKNRTEKLTWRNNIYLYEFGKHE